jgi:hypothetical protein
VEIPEEYESEKEKHFREEKEIYKHKMPEPHLIPDKYDEEPPEGAKGKPQETPTRQPNKNQ